MNLAVGGKYVMRNGQFCTLDGFDAGNEEKGIPASFSGYLNKGGSRKSWRPDGANNGDVTFDIIAVAQDPKASATYLHDFST